MTIFKCKMCGGSLEVQEGQSTVECEYCGTTQTLPNLDNEKKIKLFSRANRLRSVCEFDKAANIYENIVSEFPEEAEAYWGIMLCQYGIEYVDDPKTGNKVPTCHRSSFNCLMDDPNFEMVMEYSDSVSRAIYREEAKTIEHLRTSINEISSKEEPYDIFICYKETDEKGERTIDSVIAQDVYESLVEKGYKVFFSRITLEDKLGQEYEPYIFAALNSAKIMLVFGTDYEYFNAVWVKNEWSRYLNLIEKGEKKTLIPCYKDIDAYDIPKEFTKLQAQDMGKLGAKQDLIRGIEKIIGIPKKENINQNEQQVIDANIDALLKRAQFALEDEQWEKADQFYEEVLTQNPELAEAYLGKVFVEYKCKTLEDLKPYILKIPNNKMFKRACQFGDDKLLYQLEFLKITKQDELEKEMNQKKESIALFRKKLESVQHLMVDGRFGIKSDGTVYSTGNNIYGQSNVEDWNDIVELSVSEFHTVGLKFDGTVVATGKNNYGQCNVDDWMNITKISTSKEYTAGLKSDGTVVATGKNDYGQCNIKDWTDIIELSAADDYVVGLKSDGTVIAMGNNSEGQCSVESWTDVAHISTGDGFTIGLKSDETVVATGKNDYGQCNVGDWTDIIAIYTKHNYVVGLKTDGTAIAAGDFPHSDLYNIKDWLDIVEISLGKNCMVGLKVDGSVLYSGSSAFEILDLKKWTDIIAISVGDSYTVGLKSDGIVVSTLTIMDDRRKKSLHEWKDIISIGVTKHRLFGLKIDGTVITLDNEWDSSKLDWTDIIQISSGYNHTVGLKSDGTAVATGYDNIDGRCNVEDWTDIVALYAGLKYTFGLKADGTVVATGKNDKGQCNVQDWTDIIQISLGCNHTVGLKTDGTVIATGKNDKGQCNVQDWTNISSISAGNDFTVGLKSDGTIVITGCDWDDFMDKKNWTDVVSINVCNDYLFGLKYDSTVLVAGADDHKKKIVSGWTDIIKVNSEKYFYNNFIFGLTSDGKVFYTAKFEDLEGNTYYKDIKYSWTNIIDICRGRYFTFGLKSDGTVIANGRFPFGLWYCIDNWKLFNDFNRLIEENREERSKKLLEIDKIKNNKIEFKRESSEKKRELDERIKKFKQELTEKILLEDKEKEWRSQGLCQYCGGSFKGLFSKKCSICGKLKDY